MAKALTVLFTSRIWPTQQEIAETVASSLNVGMFEDRYASVFEGSDTWKAIEGSGGEITNGMIIRPTFIIRPISNHF